jgi:hypothetical protein
MRASTPYRSHDAPTSPPHTMPDDGSLLAGHRRKSSSDRSPEGEHQDQWSPGSLRPLARLALALLLFLMMLLAAGVLLTGDSPVDEQLPAEPAVQIR